MYTYITYIFVMKQVFSVESKFHGFLETFANQKRSGVCGAVWDKPYTGGAPLPMSTISASKPCCRDECSGLSFIFFGQYSDLTLCKFSLESVFYGCVNNRKYLAQMLGCWDVSMCCYFNRTNQILFWPDSKRLKVWNSKCYCLCVNIKTG